MKEQTLDELIAALAADVAARIAHWRALENSVPIPKALYDEWVAAQDEALNWADANARAFPIETAPDQGSFQVWDADLEQWETIAIFVDDARWAKRITHWRPLPPPPSNPPLPEPLEALGAVLRRVKGCQ